MQYLKADKQSMYMVCKMKKHSMENIAVLEKRLKVILQGHRLGYFPHDADNLRKEKRLPLLCQPNLEQNKGCKPGKPLLSIDELKSIMTTDNAIVNGQIYGDLQECIAKELAREHPFSDVVFGMIILCNPIYNRLTKLIGEKESKFKELMNNAMLCIMESGDTCDNCGFSTILGAYFRKQITSVNTDLHCLYCGLPDNYDPNDNNPFQMVPLEDHMSISSVLSLVKEARLNMQINGLSTQQLFDHYVEMLCQKESFIRLSLPDFPNWTRMQVRLECARYKEVVYKRMSMI